MDIFSLGMKADTRDLNRGRSDVEKFAQSGVKAEKKIETSTKNMGRSFNQMSGFVRAASAALAAFGAVQAVREIARVSDEYANVNSRLKLVTNSTQELESVQRSLFKIAQSTSTQYASVAELYARTAQQADALGASQKELLTLTNLTTQAFIVSGASQTESAGAIRQLTQALASGVLRGEEFNSVMEQGPRLMKALADGIGLPVGALREMAQDGQLTADIVLPALLSQAAAINAEFAQMPRTVGRSATELGNAFDQALASADVTPLVEGIDDLRKLIEDPAFVASISNLAGTLVGAFATALEWVVKLSDGIRDVWGDVMRRLHGPLLDNADAIKKSIAEIDAQIVGHENKLNSVSDTGKKWIDDQIAALEKQKAEYQSMLKLSQDLESGVKKTADANNDLTVSIDVNTTSNIKARLEQEKKTAADAKAIAAAAKLEQRYRDQLPVLREQYRLLKLGVDLDTASYMADLANATSDAEREVINLNYAISNMNDEAKESAKELKQLEEQADPYAEAWASAMERVDAAFANAWEGAFDSFESFADSLLDSFKKLLAEMAHMAITKPIVMNIQSSLSGGLGGGAGGLGGLVNTIGGLGGAGGVSAANNYGGMAGAGTSVLAGGAAPSALMSGIYSAGFSAAVAYGANSFVSALSDITSGKGDGFDALDVVFPGIGSAAESIKSAISGSGTRITGSGLDLDVMAGELIGQSFVKKKKDRGALKSTKHWTVYDDLESEMSNALQDAYDGTLNGVLSAFATLGTDVSDEMLKGFSAEFDRISLAGKTEEEVAKAIDEFMGSVASELTEWVTDTTHQEQISVERLGELASALSAVNYGLEATGIAMLDLSRYGAELAEDLIKAAGGLESFAANMSAYDAFALTDADRLARTTKQLNELFTDLGYDSLPATRGAVKDIVEGLDLTTESGQEAFASITSASSLMSDYYGSQESAAASLAKAGKAAAAAAREAEEAQAAAMAAANAAIVDTANTLFPQMREALRAVFSGQGGSYFGQFGGGGGTPIAELLAAQLSTGDLISALGGEARDELITAYEAEASAAESAADAINKSLESLRELARISVGAVDTPIQSLHRLNNEFERLSALGRGGDSDALAALSGVGGSLIESITDNAGSAFDAAQQIAAVRASLGMAIGGATAAMSAEEERLAMLREDLGLQQDIKDAVENGSYIIADEIAALRATLVPQAALLFNQAAAIQGYTSNSIATPSAAEMAARDRASVAADPNADLREELQAQREENRIALAAIKGSTDATAKKLERFDGDDGLNVRILTS